MSRDLHLSTHSVAPTADADVGVDVCRVCGGGCTLVPMFRNGTPSVSEPRPEGAYRITHSPRERVRAIVRRRGCGLGMLPVRLRNDTASTYSEGEAPAYLEQAEERMRKLAQYSTGLVRRGEAFPRAVRLDRLSQFECPATSTMNG